MNAMEAKPGTDGSVDAGVTVLTVSLNCREHFERTAASLPAELPPWMRWIVVDGASTDGTAEAARSDPRVSRCLSERDRGVYDAYNKAWQMASTPWVLFLNCGDTLMPGAPALLESCVADPRRDEEARHMHCFSVAMATRADRSWVPDPGRLPEGMSVPTPGVLFPRSGLAEVGGFDTHLRVASDYEVLLALQLRGWVFEVHEPALTRYLGGGLSHQLEHLAFFEECVIQLRRGVLSGEQVLLRAARRAVADVDPRSTPFRRWRLALSLGKRLLY